MDQEVPAVMLHSRWGGEGWGGGRGGAWGGAWGGARGGGGAEGEGGGGGTYAHMLRNGRDFRELDVEERLRISRNKKKQFESKLYLENLRREMSKGGEIITLMRERVEMSNEDTKMKKEEVAVILKESGVRGVDVEGITFNPYRAGQVEIQFKRGFTVDMAKMEEVIASKDMKIEISPYDHVEEVLIIKGIPLSDDMESIKRSIEETVRAFVIQVKRIEACKYRDGDEFFKDKYNGIWKVVVEPKKGCHIPNFIVVGREEKVQGQVFYKKKYEHRPEMCSDCYGEDHLRGDRECNGVLPWEEYCTRFESIWQEENRKTGGTGERMVNRRTAVLEERVKEVELENQALREKVGKNVDQERTKGMEEAIKSLRSQVDKHAKDDAKRIKDDEKKDRLLLDKESEIRQLKEALRKKGTRDKSVDDIKVKRNLSVEYEKERKNSKMSESLEKSAFDWEVPKKLPKKDDILWVQKGKEAVRVQVVRVADKGDFNKFMVMETEGKGDPLFVDPVKSLWQYQKPVSIESPDSSAIQDSSTPASVSGGAIRKASFMEKLKK